MKTLVSALLLLASPALALAATPTIQPGSTVFIAPMNGFEITMAAALQKKHVPLVMVSERDRADLVIEGTNDFEPASWAKTIFFSPLPADRASITVKSAKDGTILYAYSVNKTTARNGAQSAAEACAKHLKEAIEKK